MSKVRFREGSKTYQLEKVFNPDLLGTTRWVNVEELEKKVGFSVNGNGCAHIQSDRGLGKKYKIEKIYDHGQVKYIRLVGYVKEPVSRYVPLAIKKLITSYKCVFTGTTSNIVVDHKDGTYPNIDVYDINAYQPVCKSMNTIKRERCKKCKASGQRFDAKEMYYSVSWIIGGSQRTDALGCKGCFLYDPIKFRQSLKPTDANKNISIELGF